MEAGEPFADWSAKGAAKAYLERQEKRRKKQARRIAVSGRDSAGLKEALGHEGLDVFFDERRTDAVVRSDGEHVAFDDTMRAALRERLEANYFYIRVTGTGSGATETRNSLRYSKSQFEDTLDAYCHYNRRDPFRDEYLAGLPTWDGVDRIDSVLDDLFDAGRSHLSMWSSRYAFLGLVQRTFEPGCKLDEVPVLIGLAGCGKSTFCAELVPPQFRKEGFGKVSSLAVSRQKLVEATLGRIIVELEEMAGSTTADADLLKGWVSEQDDNGIRLAYRRNPVSRPRRFVVIGTADKPNVLPNDSNLRRWSPVRLNRGCDVGEYMGQHRDQLFAEAVALYRQGERANMSGHWLDGSEIRAEQAAETEKYRGRDEGIADKLAHWAGSRNHNPNDLHSPSEIYAAAELISPVRRSLQMEVATELRAMGYGQVRCRRNGIPGRYWTASKQSELEV